MQLGGLALWKGIRVVDGAVRSYLGLLDVVEMLIEE